MSGGAMRCSLRAKLFLLVGFAICLAALPIILFSRDYLLESSMEKERTSFNNTVMLVEDSISVRYLNMLAAEVESVRIAKEDLHVTSSLLRNTLLMEEASGGEAPFALWQNMLRQWDYRLAVFDTEGRPLVEDRIISIASEPSVTDFKGQSIRSKLVARPGQTNSSFAVVDIRVNRAELPLLLCFTPVPGKGMIVLATMVEKIVLGRMQTEKGMVASIAERIDELELHAGVSIAILDANGGSVARKGVPISLADIPEKARAYVRRNGKANGEGVGPEGKEFLYHLAYFKALDWYIVAVITKDAIVEPAERLTRYVSAVAGGLLVLSLIVTLLLTVRTTRPLRLLTDKAQALASEDFSSERGVGFAEGLVDDLPVERKDEVGQLAGAFAHMVKALDENIRHLVETLAVRQRMQGELNAARDIQMGILPPPDSAPEAEGYHAAAFLEPAKEVGGDLYDFFVAPDGRQAVVIGDVSDKGVSAALFMSMTVTLVRYALADGLTCAEAMCRINERLSENNPSCMFVTLFIGLFDPMTGRLDYASGAHCPPFVVSPDPAVPVRALTDVSGPLVGAMEGMEYADCHAELAPGEYCLLYTDGVSEAMDEEKALFTEERIAEVLDDLRSASPEEVLEGVMEAVKRHRGTASQSDDITMLCFKRSE